MSTKEQPFTELIVESVANGQREQAIEYFRDMRKDQKKFVLLNLAENIYNKPHVAGEAPLSLSTLKILISSLY